MKIMYIIHSLIIGGAETIVTNYLIYLKEAGQDVLLLQMFDKHTFLNQRLEEKKIKVLTACNSDDKKIFSKIQLITNLRKQIRLEKPDILHVHTGLEKFRFVKYPANRIVYTLHSDWERSLRQGRNHRRMVFKLIKRGMSIIVLNQKMKSDVLLQFPKAKVYNIPNGLELDKIKGKRYDKKKFLRQLGVSTESFILGHVGRFHKVKNHEKVIDIFARLLEKNSAACLLLVGGGSEEEEQRILRLIRENNIEEKVYLLGERKDTTEIMSIFDCFVLPSYSEACPLVLIEAQSLKIRSIVSSKVPEEICVNENCLQLGVDDDSEKWAEYAIGSCVSARNGTLEDFNINNVIKQHLELYNTLL